MSDVSFSGRPARYLTVRGYRYWFGLGLRHGYIEFGKRRLVWHIFTVPNEPKAGDDR